MHLLYFYNLRITFNSNILFHSNFPTFVYKSGIFLSRHFVVILREVSRLIALNELVKEFCQRGKSGHHRVA